MRSELLSSYLPHIYMVCGRETIKRWRRTHVNKEERVHPHLMAISSRISVQTESSQLILAASKVDLTLRYG